jgi:hypothetical protein
MNTLLKLGLSLAAVGVGGCTTVGNLTSIYRSPDLNNGESMVMDAEQWAVLNIPEHDADGNVTGDQVVCAMPSPDAMAAAAASGSFSGEAQGASAGGAMAIGESTTSIGLRTQSIQLLRDALYRMCEANANGGLDPIEYGIMMRRFQTNMIAILAIEQLTGAVVAPPAAVSAQGGGTIMDSIVRERREIHQRIAVLDRQLLALGDGEDEAVAARRDRLTQEKDWLTEDLSFYQHVVAAMTSGDFTAAQALLGQAPPSERSPHEIAAIAQTVESITLAAMSQNYQEEMCYELDRLGADPAEQGGSCPEIIQANLAERQLVPSTVAQVVRAFLSDNALNDAELQSIRALLSSIDHRYSAEDLPAAPTITAAALQ